MNIVALVAAIIGIAGVFLVLKYGKKIPNRWLRYLSITIGIIISFIITTLIPTLLFDDDSITTSADAGYYFGGIAFVYFIIMLLFVWKK